VLLTSRENLRWKVGRRDRRTYSLQVSSSDKGKLSVLRIKINTLWQHPERTHQKFPRKERLE
jgi:hypothetical protein